MAPMQSYGLIRYGLMRLLFAGASRIEKLG
jgi:hypothetical protein